jgi:two-component system, NtrC family, nitrogen regulation sensor histidine kinase NtrY
MFKNFKIKTLSLQIRIFVSMIVLLIVASIILSTISIFQFKNDAKRYHQEKLERKEAAIKENINYVLTNTDYALVSRNLSTIFKDKIHELADIHNLEINIYNLKGKLVKSSKSTFSVDMY